MRFSFRRAVNNTFIFSVDNELELEFRWIKGEEHTAVVEHGKKKNQMKNTLLCTLFVCTVSCCTAPIYLVLGLTIYFVLELLFT